MLFAISDVLRSGVVPRTVAEPASDIAAQIAAMLDPAHPKDAVFVAAGNEDALPAAVPGAIGVRRLEGVLLTTNPAKAARFRAGVDDAGMAAILGYPETKLEAIGPGARVIQVRDGAGNVIHEALASRDRVGATQAAFAGYCPADGVIVDLDPAKAIARRMALRKRETER